jgi:hypothetical protein
MTLILGVTNFVSAIPTLLFTGGYLFEKDNGEASVRNEYATGIVC